MTFERSFETESSGLSGELDKHIMKYILNHGRVIQQCPRYPAQSDPVPLIDAA